MNSVQTPKGTTLPLIQLKGKDYLQVAHRLVWFNESTDKFHVDTSFLLLTDEQTVAHVKVTVFDKDGRECKHATGTKRETKKDFPDHTEKAETGAIGRALAVLGYGTQFAIADLDEGTRLADSPVVNTRTAAKAEVKATVVPQSEEVGMSTPKISTFRKNKPAAVSSEQPKTDGWE